MYLEKNISDVKTSQCSHVGLIPRLKKMKKYKLSRRDISSEGFTDKKETNTKHTKLGLAENYGDHSDNQLQ